VGNAQMIIKFATKGVVTISITKIW